MLCVKERATAICLSAELRVKLAMGHGGPRVTAFGGYWGHGAENKPEPMELKADQGVMGLKIDQGSRK